MFVIIKTQRLLAAGILLCASTHSLSVPRAAHAQGRRETPAVFAKLERAVELIGNNQLAQAETLLASVLTATPQNANALNLFGVVRAQQRRTTEAERLFRRAIAASPAHLGAHVNLGELLLTTNRHTEALQILITAHNLAPDRYDINLNLAKLYASRREFAQADAYLTAALQAQPDDVGLLRMAANVARANGELEKSLARLIHARRIAPESLEVLYDFGVTAFDMELLLDALPAFERLHAARPDESVFIFALAAARLKKGEKGEAEQLLRRYIELRPQDARGFYLLGVALHSLNRYKDAREALERSLALKAAQDAEYLLGMIYDEEGNSAASIERLQNVLRGNPDHPGALAALGAVYRKTGKYQEARPLLERAVKLNPKAMTAHYQLGLLYAKAGDKENAKRMFDRADDLRGEQRNQESVVLKLIEPPQP